MNEDERLKFTQWVIENINSNVVPMDEGNSEALIYNLVHLIKGDGKEYDYLPEQDKEIESWAIF